MTTILPTEGEEVSDLPDDSSAPVKTRRRRLPRKPVRRTFILTHRWMSLILGIVLLAITTTGVLVVYSPELDRAWFNKEAYQHVEGDPQLTWSQAVEAVQAENPKFVAGDTIFAYGVYQVPDADYETYYNVDPVNGHVTKRHDPPWWFSLSENIHYCFLSCDDYVGYVPFLAKEVPHSEWLGYEGTTKVTWSGLILGLMGLMLVYLVLTGLWLWFPRPSKWKSGFTVRWGRGRFVRDTDLHKMIGIVALLPLLMWGVTGTAFEFGFMEKAWYAVTPGKPLEEVEAPAASMPAKGQEPITQEEAAAAAQKLHPDYKLISVSVLPAADSEGFKDSAYSAWFSDHLDAYGYGSWPGDVPVTVDKYTGEATQTSSLPGRPLNQVVWEDWNYSVHAGVVVNGWWRSLWVVFGLTMLVLAFTGVSTWLFRLGTKRRRKKALKARAADVGTATETEELTSA